METILDGSYFPGKEVEKCKSSFNKKMCFFKTQKSFNVLVTKFEKNITLQIFKFQYTCTLCSLANNSLYLHCYL